MTEPTEQQILEAAFAPAQPAAEASRFGSPELQAMIIARCVEKVQADSVLEDAARYRYLRDGTLVDGAINDELYVHIDSSAYPGRWALVGAELDEAVDAARAAQKKGREKP